MLHCAELHWLVAAVSIAVCLRASQSTFGAVCRARLNGLSIAIDEQTGGIVSMSYPPVGTFLDATERESGILDVAYPLEVFAPMRLASQFSNARVLKENGGIRMVWDRLGPSRTTFPMPEGNVSAEVRIQAAGDERSIIMSCRIDNHSGSPVRQVLFPDLRGLKAIDGRDTELRLSRNVAKPFAEAVQSPESAAFYVDRGWQEYPPTNYGQNPLRWLDYGSLKGGLSVFQKKWGTMDAPCVRTQRTEADSSRLRLLWDHNVTIEPGGSWESGEFWLTPHRGGWAKGIEPFREYVGEVNPPREMPRRVRDGLGFQTIWMTQAAEIDPNKAAFRFSDLPRVARDAAAHGLNELCLWGYCTYFTLPIPLRSELGTREEFLEGIRKAGEMGVDVVPFISIQIVRPQYAGRYGLKSGDADWTYHPELVPNFRPYHTKFLDGTSIECDNQLWQKDVYSSLSEWIDLGAQSIAWDVFGYPYSGEKQPALVSLAERIRTKARARNPESIFAGESSVTGSLEHDGAVLDHLWMWIDYHDAGPVLNVLRAPRPNCNIEESPLIAEKAFSDGLYLNLMPRKLDQPNGTALISEKPALSATIKQCAALRKQFLPYFTEGIFLGNSILSKPVNAHVAAHQLGAKILIIVVNEATLPETVKLDSDLGLWLPAAKHYVVKTYDSSGKLVSSDTWRKGQHWTAPTRRLQPLDMVLYELQAE